MAIRPYIIGPLVLISIVIRSYVFKYYLLLPLIKYTVYLINVIAIISCHMKIHTRFEYHLLLTYIIVFYHLLHSK